MVRHVDSDIDIYEKLWLILLVCVPFLSDARERDVDTARDIAYDFLESKARTKSSSISLTLVYSGAGLPQTRSAGQAPSYYVFDNGVGPGEI